MDRGFLTVLGALVFLLPLSTHAKYLRDPNICGIPTCPSDSNKFGYKPNVKYNYNYKVQIESIFEGAGNSSSKMWIQASFYVQFKSICEGVLKITDARLSGADEKTSPDDFSQLFNEKMTKNYLRFAFEDGKIHQICPTNEDHVWVFNFKKGILSSLQNTMRRFDVDSHVFERDVNGDCKTSYHFKEQQDTSLVVTKKKKISSCTHRHSFYSIIPTTHYIFQQKYHKWTPMNSSYICHQYIDHKILTKVVCDEDHTFEPFYSKSNGVKTLSRSELKLDVESDDSEDFISEEFGLVRVRDDLLFNHRRPKRATHDDINECKILLRRLCTLSAEEFHGEFPDVFNQFIHFARDLSTPALTQLFKDSNSTCPTGRKHIKNALPFIRSRASTYLMTEVILNREISEQKIQEWLTVMAFFPRPDGETVESVSSLLSKQQHIDGQTMLSVGAMIHSYCENHPDCHLSPSLIDTISSLEANFNSSLSSVHPDKKLMSLKAIGNAGVKTPTMEKSLQTCLNDENLDTEIRINCVHAHRRMPCLTNRDNLISILKNQSIDQEMRIASYIQLMRCPSYHTLDAVKTFLVEEKFNQVGSFVWSHLQNTMKSSMPNRMEVQAIFQDEELKDKFKKDFRKFSRHYESSFFLNSLGIGGIVENSVIFSEKSYFPRSFISNISIDLFGESVNIAEFTVRVEGLDKQLEKWFSKSDFWKQEQFFKSLNPIRVLREATSKIQDLIKDLKYKHQGFSSLKISFSVKMFGNEVKYYIVDGSTDLKRVISKLNPLKIIKDFLSGKEVSTERSTMLLDTSYVTPMATGLPLKFNVVGTVAVNVNAMGFVNASQLTEEGYLEIDGKLNPSIGFSFEAYKFVDAFVEESGVKFKGTVYTSTALEASFKSEGYKHVTVSFNIPMKKSQIFYAETQLSIVNGNNIVPVATNVSEREETRICTWSFLDATIGLKLCLTHLLPKTSLLLESPLFLFSGPLKLGLTLEKSDPTANKYFLEYKMENIHNKTLITFNFETPGSETKRGMKAVIDLDTLSQNLTLAYQSSLSTVRAQGFYRNTPSEKSINFGLDINGKKHIDIYIGMELEKERNGFIYRPGLNFSINGKKIASLSGSYRWVEKKGLSQCEINLDFQTNRFSTNIVGFVRKTDVSIGIETKVDYSFNRGKSERVDLLLTFIDKSSKFLTQFQGDLRLTSTAYPQINMVSSLKYHNAQGHIECRVEINSDPQIKDEAKKLNILWIFQYLRTMASTRLNTSLQVTKKASDIDFSIGITHYDTFSSMSSITSTALLFKYATGKEVKAILDLSLPHENVFNFESNLKIIIPQAIEPLNIYLRINEKYMKGEYDIEFVGRWFSGHNMTVRGAYLDRSTLTLTSYSLKLLAQSALFKDIHFSSRFLMNEQEYKIELQAEHDVSKYDLVFRHTTLEDGIYETYAAIQYNDTLYNILNHMDIIQRKTVFELHLDKYRDIKIVLKGFTNKTRLDAGIDVKWDANRDPSRKFIFTVKTTSHGYLNSDLTTLVEYPGRVINIDAVIDNKDKEHKSSVTVKWAAGRQVHVYVEAMHDIRRKGLAKFRAVLATPFANWENTIIDYNLHIKSQALHSQGSIDWSKNQTINGELSYDYLFEEDLLVLNFLSSLNSSIPEVNSMHAIFKHNQTSSYFHSKLSLKNNPNSEITLESNGGYSPSEDDNSSKYHLMINLMTPFSFAKKAQFTSEMNIFPEYKIKGSVHFIGNDKKYVMYIDGSLKQFTESKLHFYITTPFEKYKQITGRYGFSSSSKHFLLDIKSSSASVGLEVVYVFHNSSNFDMKLHLHTSLVYASNLIIVGNINDDTVDVRLGWNRVLLGLIGRSHYTSWDDVDYSLQLFTPIEGFPKCSAIAKLIFKEKIDFEASVNFADKKIGLRIQAMESPDDEFAVPMVTDKEEKPNNETTVSLQLEQPQFGTVHSRAVMQLDSLLFPTVYATAQVNKDDIEYYLVIFFNFPFGQMIIKDDLEFKDLLNIKNKLLVESTCDCLQEVSGDFSLEGNWEKEGILPTMKTTVKLSKTIYNVTDKINVDLIYKFEPLDEHTVLEGKYELELELETPFDVLPYWKVGAELHAERHDYMAVLTTLTSNASLSLDATLAFDDATFDSNIGIQLTSPLINLPHCRLSINRDFSGFEKKLDIGLALPNKEGDSLVKYGVGANWYDDVPNFLKYFGHIITPYERVGNITGGFQMKNDYDQDQFFLDLFLKYSVASKIKLTSTLKGNKLSLQADSSFDGFRDINVTTYINKRGRKNHVEATLIASKDYKLVGRATYAPDQPMKVEIKMLKPSSTAPTSTPTNDQDEIFKVIAQIYWKNQGYVINALLTHYDKSVYLNGNYKLWDDIGKEIQAEVTTSYPGYESLNVSGILLTRTGSLMLARLSSDITSKLITTNIKLGLNVSFEGEGGIIRSGITSPMFTGKGSLVWVNKFLERMILQVDGDCAYRNLTKDLSLNLYSWNLDRQFQQMSVGSDLSYNNRAWRFIGNATVLSNDALDDIVFLSHVLLPYKINEFHITAAKLKYLEDWSYFSHLIKYTKGDMLFKFKSVSEIEMTQDDAKGALLVETKNYRFFDKFNGNKVEHGYDLSNMMQSTNMNHDLLMKLSYKKPFDRHQIWVDAYYPPSEAIVKSYLDFLAINNVLARMNCTTPFDAFPEVQLLLNVISTKPFYQRYAQINWRNNSALFNYTHASTIDNLVQMTDGSILVDFPLASRHIGHLKYTYESTDSNAEGESDLYYNNEYIMGGTYHRDTTLTLTGKNEVINIKINNSYVPIGIIYIRKIDAETEIQVSHNIQDFRRVEIYRLYDSSGFNLTGEYEINVQADSKLRTLRGFIGERMFSINANYQGAQTFSSNAIFNMKENVWIGYDFSKKKMEDLPGYQFELNVTYPRRLLIIASEYHWSDSDFHSIMVINPNQIKRAQYFGGELGWTQSPFSEKKNAFLKILHPSFHKNVTLSGSYDKNDTALFNADMDFEYSVNEERKLSLNTTVTNKSKNKDRYYSVISYGIHPATRLSFSGLMIGKILNGMIEFHRNISYKRSYLPFRFWSSHSQIDFRRKSIDVKSDSEKDSSHLYGQYYTSGNVHLANASYFHGKDSKVYGNFSLDTVSSDVHLDVDLTPDSSEQLHMDGHFNDQRHVKLNIWRNYDKMSVRDVSFYLRLNTSRMLTSEFSWRPTIPNDILGLSHSYSNELWTYTKETANFWTTYIKNEVAESIMDLWLDARPILQDFMEDIKDVKDLQDDIVYFKQIFNESYAANEFYMQDIYNMYLLLMEEISFKDKMNNFPKIVSELWEVMGETGETMRQSILWAIELVQKVYSKIVTFTRELLNGETLNKITSYLQEFAGKYDKIIKDVHISFLTYMEYCWHAASEFISLYWEKISKLVTPFYIQLTHHLESLLWYSSLRTLEFLFQGPAELIKSSVFSSNSNFSKEFDMFYKDITSNDLFTNIRKYSQLFFDIIRDKYFSSVPFGYELNEISNELVAEVKELYKLPIVNFTLEASLEVYNQIKWMYNYFKIGDKLQRAIPMVYRTVIDASHTALDNELINHRPKTLFILDIDTGLIKLEQKLPMPWHAFNETPNFEEVPEYKVLSRFQKLFAPSNFSFWTVVYQNSPLLDPMNWFPPFGAQAVISGMHHFITFDKAHYDLKMPCDFLLSHDFQDNSFSLVLKYSSKGHHIITLVINKDLQIFLDLHDDIVSWNQASELSLPLQIDDTYIYEDDEVMRIISERGYSLQCNFERDVCVFSLHGWYFGKVAGLLGTMDNEPENDFLSSNGRLEKDLNRFIQSWSLGSCEHENTVYKKPLNANNSGFCNSIFQSKASSFSTCYSSVDPQQFGAMCRRSLPGLNDEICTSAYSYIKACEAEEIPLSMPHFCVRCKINDVTLYDGEFTSFNDSHPPPPSTDVVFIMEVKECNQYMREKRLVQTFMTILKNELSNKGLVDNRFGLVTFGGDGIFDEPRKIIKNNNFFTNERTIISYFDNITSGVGNSDIFLALRFATRLPFRPGVSKTFILLPCSDCDPSNLTLEYSVLQQIFMEKDIKLHILMNADFDLEKLRVSKSFYGIDSDRAYTKSDFKSLKGDMDLRRQIKLTKSMLGHCTPLALGSNGTIFTGKKFGSENTALVKKFCIVLARRIAATARPSTCQKCECGSSSEGSHRAECYPCHLPSPFYTHFEFRDNATLSLFDRFDHSEDSDFGF